MNKMMILTIITIILSVFPVYSSRGCPIYYNMDAGDECAGIDCEACCSEGRFSSDLCQKCCNGCYPYNAEAYAEFKDFPN